jgi:hypothetical protein
MQERADVHILICFVIACLEEHQGQVSIPCKRLGLQGSHQKLVLRDRKHEYLPESLRPSMHSKGFWFRCSRKMPDIPTGEPPRIWAVKSSRPLYLAM